MQRLSAIFRDADLAQPPPDFTSAVMSQLTVRRAEQAQLSGRSAWLPSGALAAMLALASISILYFAALAQGWPWPITAGHSIDVLNLSMVASGPLLQTAGLADQALRLASTIGRLVPLPAFVGMFMWLAFGALALSITLAALLHAYPPVAVQAAGVSAPQQDCD